MLLLLCLIIFKGQLTNCIFYYSFAFAFLHEKNDFAEGFKILLNTDLKIILLDHQNNIVETLKIMRKKFWHSSN